MSQPRNDNVRLRLTTLEKSDWTKAAGGSRKLSEWIRAQCNKACEEIFKNAPQPEHEVEIKYVPNTKPVIVGDAIEREVLSTGGRRSGKLAELEALQEQAHRESRSLPDTGDPGDDSKGKARTASTGGAAAAALSGPVIPECPRWMHHREGVYCGSCKRVIGR